MVTAVLARATVARDATHCPESALHLSHRDHLQWRLWHLLRVSILLRSLLFLQRLRPLLCLFPTMLDAVALTTLLPKA
jgi:hypothetical protein